MCPEPTPTAQELIAPSAWRLLEFISDLHLQASEPETLFAWERYMAQTQADAVFILGDLFEVWVGDDVTSDASGAFEERCGRILKATAERCAVFFMHGNRDFLLGPAYAQRCQLSLLDDPTVLTFAQQRFLLSHGDALCLDDTEYLAFRAQVRTAAWQDSFLHKPLAERQAIAQAMRQQSEARKRSASSYADVDAGLACAWLGAAQASELIHGHTHRPADHLLGQGLRRRVLSDWDSRAEPARVQVLRLSLSPDQGLAVQRVDSVPSA